MKRLVSLCIALLVSCGAVACVAGERCASAGNLEEKHASRGCRRRVLVLNDKQVPQSGVAWVYGIDGSVNMMTMQCGYLDFDWKPLARAEVQLDSGNRFAIMDFADDASELSIVRLAPIADVTVRVSVSNPVPWRVGAVLMRKTSSDAVWVGGVLISDNGERVEYCDNDGVAHFSGLQYGHYEIASLTALPLLGARKNIAVDGSSGVINLDVATIDCGTIAGWQIKAQNMPLFGTLDRGRFIGGRVVCRGRSTEVPVWFDGLDLRAVVSVGPQEVVELEWLMDNGHDGTRVVHRGVLRAGVIEEIVLSDN